jgi:SagB-type dehydrogenase family enzyme
MEQTDVELLRVVRDYHQRTKHHLDQYAASPGFMDWANQPNPFRSFDGAARIELPHPALQAAPTYDSLFTNCPTPRPLDADLLGRLFHHSLALSAWKEIPGSAPWSLRINPSSGALHPTEGYLITGPVSDLIDEPGVFHYAPFHHALERRCRIAVDPWHLLSRGLPADCLLVGLTSIYWRESWKYGERAFRYCHHDVGHAIGAISFAARTLGYDVHLLESLEDADLDRLLGTHAQTGIEAEHADCLLAVYPSDSDGARGPLPCVSFDEWRETLVATEFFGEPNRLSRDHHPWPAIEQVAQAARRGPIVSATAPRPTPTPFHAWNGAVPDRNRSAEQIIRQRRSAVDMDGRTSLAGPVFYQMLHRTLPCHFPFRAMAGVPRVSLVLFVHRVADLEPGLYLFARDPAHETPLRHALRRDWDWVVPAGCPGGLSLYRLRRGDVRPVARAASCHQDIAADGAFSLGMLAQFDAALEEQGPGTYPRLFWETGLIGQVLYLEAEAAGIRGTGIGCFFDDMVHEMLGIGDRSWQSLYHFTMGGPVDDPRLRTIPPYAHLDSPSR